MTATPWPHGWRPGMRLVAVPEYQRPAVLVWSVGLDSSWLKCGDVYGDVAASANALDPRTQPDLDDDGTLGHLKGMVRDRRGESFYSAFYVLELDEEFKIDDDGASPGWFDPVTARSYATEGEAYKAALDALAVTP